MRSPRMTNGIFYYRSTFWRLAIYCYAKKQMSDKPAGYTFGRPTTYRAEYCERVIELGKLGKSLVQICSELDVVKGTLFNWCDNNPDFLTAMEKSRSHAQNYWESIGHDGMLNKSIDASIWSRSMAARFPADWRESKHQEVTGANGGLVNHSLKIEFVDSGNPA